MALREVVRRIVGQPDLAFGIFPHEGSLGQVDAHGLCALHEGCADFGIPEYQELRGAEVCTDTTRTLGVVYPGKDPHALLLQRRDQSLHGVLHAAGTGHGHQAVGGCRHRGEQRYR